MSLEIHLLAILFQECSFCKHTVIALCCIVVLTNRAKNQSASKQYPSETVGMLDMGGASMQIAYEVPAEVVVSDDLIMNFTVGQRNTTSRRTYRVYVMTFLSYGTHATSSR
ncbi:unnamed protein product [Dibothriocephalus latus]|uniref:Uncharacterized protein n=1 Tax=Dibothriocephalus latus TaxID=60516 RepID=A0A3P7LGR7_DIBLA|nr:unnamed protein product [Dibothriocephalus latus]